MTGRTLNLFVALWLGCLLCACLAVWAAQAAPTRCQTMAATQAEIAGVIAKNGGETLTLDRAETAAYLGVVNEQPPVTAYAGDALVFLAIPGQGVVLGLQHGALVCIEARIAPELHAKALLVARGQGV